MSVSIERNPQRSYPSPATRLGLLALLVFLAGCGNKGPLYLPSSPEPQGYETSSTDQIPVVELYSTTDNK